MKRSGPIQRKSELQRGSGTARRSRIGETKIRQLKPGEPIPEGEPRRYTSDSRGYVRLRWKVGKGEYVETYEHRLVVGVPEADVHHHDEDKTNNSPENLHVLGRVEHAKEHAARGRQTAKRWTEWNGEKCREAFEKKQRSAARRAERAEFLKQIAEMYESGMSTTSIGEKVGVAGTNISRCLRQAGVVPRLPGRKNPAPGVAPAARQVVHARAKMRCERCNKNLVWVRGQVHHRRPRAMGGSKADDTNTPGNLVLLCVECHQECESHRAQAFADGWLVRSTMDPTKQSIILHDGQRVFLHPEMPCYLDEPYDTDLPALAG